VTSRLTRLAAWQARLGPWGRASWRGGLRGFATFMLLVGLWVFSLVMGEDHSPLLVLGWGGWAATSLGIVGAFEERWGKQAPWRTAFLCNFVGWLACLGAIAQWGYMAGVEGGQIAGWESALAALSRVRKDVWVALFALCQLLGATVLVRRKPGPAGFFYANVAISLVMFPIGLFLVCSFEDWVWSVLEKAAPTGPSDLGSPDPEVGASG
jgi:hypothetical protein